MQTILQILKMAGGWHPGLYLKIDNAAVYGACHRGDGRVRPDGTSRALRRSLWRTERRPHARPGDVLRAWHGRRRASDPFYWRNDYVAVEQWSRNIVRDHYVHLVQLHEQHERFAETWDNNLRLQGFAEAFTDKCIRG